VAQFSVRVIPSNCAFGQENMNFFLKKHIARVHEERSSLLVIYTENKLRSDYAEKLGEK
jgi:hypothetical protein